VFMQFVLLFVYFVGRVPQFRSCNRSVAYLIVFVVGWCFRCTSCCRFVAILFLSYVVDDIIFCLLFFFRIMALYVFLVVVVSSSLFYMGGVFVRLVRMSGCNCSVYYI
jgi:hypothetical protein